jgi:hypothetical protein
LVAHSARLKAVAGTPASNSSANVRVMKRDHESIRVVTVITYADAEILRCACIAAPPMNLAKNDVIGHVLRPFVVPDAIPGNCCLLRTAARRLITMRGLAQARAILRFICFELNDQLLQKEQLQQ